MNSKQVVYVIMVVDFIFLSLKKCSVLGRDLGKVQQMMDEYFCSKQGILDEILSTSLKIWDKFDREAEREMNI